MLYSLKNLQIISWKNKIKVFYFIFNTFYYLDVNSPMGCDLWKEYFVERGDRLTLVCFLLWCGIKLVQKLGFVTSHPLIINAWGRLRVVEVLCAVKWW